MKKLMGSGVVLAASLGLLTSTSGCYGGEDTSPSADDSTAGVTEQPLYYWASKVWSDTSISVCWEASYPATQRQWTRNAVEAAIEPLVNVDFTGWGVCDANGAEITIRVGDTEWPSAFLGERAPSLFPNVYLNFFSGAQAVDGFANCFANNPNSALPTTGLTGRKWPTYRQRCIETIAVHEFAHVLAVAHEQGRSDAPPGCKDDSVGSFTSYGYFDLTSVSNYCNPAWNNDGMLSPLDVAGLQALYGDRGNDQVWFGVGDVDRYSLGLSPYGIHQTLFDIRAQSAAGTYQPLTGDFNGDGRDDVYWYRPGNGTDSIWFGSSNRTFDKSHAAQQVAGTYVPAVGDFDGDGRSDIWWHVPGTGMDKLWWGRSDGNFDSTNADLDPGPGGSYTQLIAGNFDGDAYDDVFFYAPGAGAERIFWGRSFRTGFNYTAPSTVSTSYRPFAGDFDGDNRDDIFWYQPGDGSDPIWWGNSQRTSFGTVVTQNSVVPTYDPVVGDFDRNGTSDVLWSRPGNIGSDSLWLFEGRTSHRDTNITSTLENAPFGGDFDGDGAGDVLWYAPN